MLGNFMSLLPSAEFSFEIKCLKKYPVQAVDKVLQANIRCSWIKIWRLFAYKKNSTTFNLRICVFPQFVIFKFNVEPRFAN